MRRLGTRLAWDSRAQQGAAVRRCSRRVAVRGALTLAGAVLLGGCAVGGASERTWDGRFLTIATIGGALGEALASAAFASFARASGCRVQAVALPVDALVAELRRQLFSGRVEWDLVVLDAPRLVALGRELPGLFAQPGALAALPGADLPAALRDLGVPLLTDTLVAGARPAAFGGRVPTGWGAIWAHDRFPGTRYVPRDPVGLLEAAALADGVSPEKLYPLDLDRVFAALDRVRPALTAWWANPERAAEALTTGAADLLVARGGEVRAALAGGTAAVFVPGATVTIPVALAALRGAPNGDVARAFFTHALLAETQGALRAAGYQPWLADDDHESDAAVASDLDWWAAQGGAALARFAAWWGSGG
ncbi:MAG TPA: extracellular solute-binding protein [Thermomicrobiales bacterium]